MQHASPDKLELLAQATSKLTQLDHAIEPAADANRREDEEVEDLRATLDEYQEKPHLLDPHLEPLVSPLLAVLRRQVSQSDALLSGTRLNRLAKVIYHYTKVRGSKVLARFFPHETSDLSLLIPLLSTTFTPSSNATIPSPLSSASWQLRYILLLWLSVAIRQPFDLQRLDSRAGERVELLGFEAVKRASKEGDGAAELLAWYFSRQDVPLDRLLAASESVFTAEELDPPLITAHLSLLSSVLRNAQPARLLTQSSRLYHLLALLPSDTAKGKGGAMLSKTRCKVAGRLALLKLGKSRGEEEDVPEEVEVVIGELVEDLGHPHTIPRYSSAKYLSRLCEALPPSFALQVVDAVLTTLEEALVEAKEHGMADRAEGKVQGACLACGEMARRGLFGRGGETDGQIGRVVDAVLQALAFDYQHLSRSLGTSARDSAAYVLWSLSRTVPASLIKPQAQIIAERLVCTALFDREVQVRRAASAAFQEGVGRWSIFPHGIDILVQVDFFTVSVRHRAYLQAAPFVARYAEYRSAILTDLVETGLLHYDPELRELSAKALGKVVELDAADLAPPLIIQQIEKLAISKDIAKLHGGLLSLASVSESLVSLPADQVEALRKDIFRTTTSLLTPCSRQLKSSPLVLGAALSALASSAPPPLAPFSASSSTLLAEIAARSATYQQVAALLLGKVNYSSGSQRDRLGTVVRRFQSFVQRQGSKSAASVEARRNGVEALANLVCSYSSFEGLSPLLPSSFDALLLGFSDYTTDQRGDVGSWVRISTLKAWASVLPALLAAPSTSSACTEHLVDKVVSCMLKQAVERLDNVREVAGKALMKVWGELGGKVVKRAEVWEAVEAEERQRWRELGWASEKLLPLLSEPAYRDELLAGTVLAASQFSSSTPFLDYALLLPPLPPPSSDNDTTSFSLVELLRALHTLAKANFSSNRVFLPFLHLLTSLAEAGSLEEVAHDETGAGEKVLKSLLALANNGIAKIKSPQRLAAAAKVAVAFLALPRVAPAASEKIPLFLSHPQTWLRQQVADDVYGQAGALGPDEEEQLVALLTETDWSSSTFLEEKAKKAGEVLLSALRAREQ
ncbi:hypothetical protein JCM8547_005133 [Rhodosporidiobolus lusitaniae]